MSDTRTDALRLEADVTDNFHHIACCFADRTLCGLPKDSMSPTHPRQSGKPWCILCVEIEPTSTCVLGSCPEGRP